MAHSTSKTLPTGTTIQDQHQLDAVVSTCRAEGRFAFDTEFVMEDRFEAEVCLIQIATKSTIAVIDPFLGIDVRGIWELVCDKSVQTVVHAGQEDLSLCVQHTGRVPQNIYDVQIAAGLAGYDYPLSLQKLVQATLRVRLHKAKTLTDWRRRPLNDEQIRYGAEDVCHLLAVRQKLHDRLTRKKRVKWASEEFARFEELSLYRRVEEEKLLRLKGTGALRGRQLAVVRELLSWREELAKHLNRPIRSVLKDHLLVEIGKIGISSYDDIRELRGLNLNSKQIQALAKTVERALKIPSDKWPKVTPRDTETAKETPLIALITGVLRSYCQECDLAYGLVAAKKSIRELVRLPVDGKDSANTPELYCGWRNEAVGDLLRDLLSGKGSVHVAIQEGHRVLEVRRSK